jgi:hypothetical protein
MPASPQAFGKLQAEESDICTDVYNDAVGLKIAQQDFQIVRFIQPADDQIHRDATIVAVNQNRRSVGKIR